MFILSAQTWKKKPKLRNVYSVTTKDFDVTCFMYSYITKYSS